MMETALQSAVFIFFSIMLGIFEHKQTNNYHAFQIKCGNVWYSIVMKLRNGKLVVGIEAIPEDVKAEFKPEDGDCDMSFDDEPYRRTFECPDCGGFVTLHESNLTSHPDMWMCENPKCTFEREAN